MRIFAIIISSLVAASMALSAQVTNYALRLDAGGSVDCGAVLEMDARSSYSIQLWLCPDQWTPNATLLSVGSNFSIELGAQGSLNVNVGDVTMPVNSASLSAGRGLSSLWCAMPVKLLLLSTACSVPLLCCLNSPPAVAS